MTKADLVKEISQSTGVKKDAVCSIIESFMSTIQTSLSNDKNIYLRGFGSFIIMKRAEKKARNISRNTTIIIPEHNVPLFKPCSSFKKLLDGK